MERHLREWKVFLKFVPMSYEPNPLNLFPTSFIIKKCSHFVPIADQIGVSDSEY